MPKKNKLAEDEIEVIAKPLSTQDEQLNALFDKMESSSLETLENAARQIITLSTALLGAFFGLLAFKDAPTYLGFYEIKAFGTLALTAFLASLFAALMAVSPKRYEFPRASLTAKRRALDDMMHLKQNAVAWASWIFGFGALLMLVAALDILLFRI
jgi:hypothetical protein